MAKEDMHVLMLPWSAFGHMILFFHLSVALAKAGIRVSFVSTTSNIQRLPSRYVGRPNSAPQDSLRSLETTTQALQDFFSHWTAEISRELNLNIRLILFSVFSAAMHMSQTKNWSSPETFTSPPEWFLFPSTIAFRPFEAGPFLAGFFGSNASGTSDAERVTLTWTACEAIAIRSCKQYEGDYLDVLEKLYRRPLIPVGVLPPPSEKKSFQGEMLSIFKWLDRRGQRMTRKPCQLPTEFRARTEGRGVVCMGWIPQMEILAHHPVGGSLFHSGWGSIIETLQFGHTLVPLPLVFDQGLNARLLVDEGLAIEVERDKDGPFDQHGIAGALRKTMVDREGESLRLQAREMKTVFGDQKLHQAYMGGFIQFLKNGLKA
ncbi:hypothetical protein NE237_027755 [Protea cynaroides]|uniref:Uncharacterized protein n=1 Tax=Protea cynaroides TaxID=273540 RepID=A0A9Q0GNK3_9MAGN|nr:hypothetical protein NE237_027755 [Protea cynaroides]